jgi:hypothetical protein
MWRPLAAARGRFDGHIWFAARIRATAPEENGFLAACAANGGAMGIRQACKDIKKAGNPKAAGRHFSCDMDARINPS